MNIVTRQLGLMPYEDCWRLQLELIEERREDRIPDTLLFVQHPSVITLGRKSPGVRDGAALPAELGGVPVHIIERGGEATYHGPGQLVVYPLLSLNIKFGPKALLRLMEEALVAVLASYGLAAFWEEGATGVWLQDSQNRKRKVASLGIAVRRGVSYHGLALNVSNDLRPFALISPCGYEPAVMTSLEQMLTDKAGVRLAVDFDEVSARLEAELRERLGAVEPAAPLVER